MEEARTQHESPLLHNQYDFDDNDDYKGDDASVAWRHVSYSVGNREILNDVSGRVNAGEVLAIVGPSGAGKTSLLNAIAGRVPNQRNATLKGEVRFAAGHVEVPQSALGETEAFSAAYVTQDDALYALSTVYETFAFVAALRLPRDTSIKDRERRINHVVAELNLRPCVNTIVGGALTVGEARGISGGAHQIHSPPVIADRRAGERKRTHIGCDLLHRPRFIFLDEPTSGLDSFQALSLVMTLRSLARGEHSKSKRVIVASLHQPRSAIYNSLDALCVMAAGGRVAFFGKQEPASAHFAAAGYPVPASFNPADHFLDVASLDFRTDDRLESSKRAIEAVCMLHAANAAPLEFAECTGAGTALSSKRQSADYSHELLAFYLLTARGWREQTRNKGALIFKWTLNAFFSVMFGLVYWQLGRDQTSIQNRQGIIFFICMNVSFGGPISVSQVIPAQLKVVNSERASRLYSEVSFLLATFVVNLPLECIPELISASVMYFMVSLRPGSMHFFIYTALILLEQFVGIGLGMALSVSLKQPEMAGQIAPAVSVLFLMFSGYFLNESSIPIWVRWLKYISFIRYTFQALAVNEFRGAKFSCHGTDDEGACVRNGNIVLKSLDFNRVSIVENMVVLVGMILGFNALALCIFAYNRPRFLAFSTPKAASSARIEVTGLGSSAV